jgi:hypothetical protein
LDAQHCRMLPESADDTFFEIRSHQKAGGTRSRFSCECQRILSLDQAIDRFGRRGAKLCRALTIRQFPSLPLLPVPRVPAPLVTDERVRPTVAHRPAALDATAIREQRDELAVALQTPSVVLRVGFGVPLAPVALHPPRTWAAVALQPAKSCVCSPRTIPAATRTGTRGRTSQIRPKLSSDDESSSFLSPLFLAGTNNSQKVGRREASSTSLKTGVVCQRNVWPLNLGLGCVKGRRIAFAWQSEHKVSRLAGS